MLGLSNATSNEEIVNDQGSKGIPSQGKQIRKQPQQSPASATVSDIEASVLATFEFLNEQSREHGGQRVSGSGQEEDEDAEEEEEDMIEDGESNYQ